jgi:hypothetical protein
LNTIPKPGENDGGGFSKTSRDVDESRTAFRAAGQPFGFGTVIAVTAREARLVIVWRRFARGGLKKSVGRKSAHDLPPSRNADAKCLVMDCLFKLAARQGQIRAASFSADFTSVSEPVSYGKHEKSPMKICRLRWFFKTHAETVYFRKRKNCTGLPNGTTSTFVLLTVSGIHMVFVQSSGVSVVLVTNSYPMPSCGQRS